MNGIYIIAFSPDEQMHVMKTMKELCHSLLFLLLLYVIHSGEDYVTVSASDQPVLIISYTNLLQQTNPNSCTKSLLSTHFRPYILLALQKW